ncbi:hypothetical protein H5410_001079 [Solanum commersonii]|uniref:F-box associated beta-propeller type 3 domain-containing protein n=1 Tax=Solanum commersonii TaxID=4109 RepID=A0A9J6AYK8_SOLCO|nr:hypothetical protein H5410_001079 [Solanum commersonii]
MWRETRSIFPFLPYGEPRICINGVIYQFVRAHKCAIGAFDVKSEKLEIITLRKEIQNSFDNICWRSLHKKQGLHIRHRQVMERLKAFTLLFCASPRFASMELSIGLFSIEDLL